MTITHRGILEETTTTRDSDYRQASSEKSIISEAKIYANDMDSRNMVEK